MAFDFSQFIRRLLPVLHLLVACWLLCAQAVPALAEHGASVRVGYYENEVFQEGAAPGAVRTGYAYEYYRKLSEYTGWKYEYVYGSFGELYEKLLKGEIDLLAGLAWKEDRKGRIGFPETPMGSEIYSLVKHENDESITAEPSTLSGRKIGVLDSAVAGALAKYLAMYGVKAKIVTFKDYTALYEAFDGGQVDVLAAEGDGAYGRKQAEVLCAFGASDYYLCTSIARPELLDELNSAQTRLQADEPHYLHSLLCRGGGVDAVLQVAEGRLPGPLHAVQRHGRAGSCDRRRGRHRSQDPAGTWRRGHQGDLPRLRQLRQDGGGHRQGSH